MKFELQSALTMKEDSRNNFCARARVRGMLIDHLGQLVYLMRSAFSLNRIVLYTSLSFSLKYRLYTGNTSLRSLPLSGFVQSQHLWKQCPETDQVWYSVSLLFGPSSHSPPHNRSILSAFEVCMNGIMFLCLFRAGFLHSVPHLWMSCIFSCVALVLSFSVPQKHSLCAHSTGSLPFLHLKLFKFLCLLLFVR